MKGYHIVACIALAASLALGAPAKADWIDHFDGTLSAWGFGNANGLGAESGTFSPSIVSGTLQLTDPTIPNLAGALIGGGVQAESFTNVVVSGVLNPGHASNLNGNVGLTARADLNTVTAYWATVNFTNGAVGLTRAQGFVWTPLATGSISGFNPAQSVYL